MKYNIGKRPYRTRFDETPRSTEGEDPMTPSPSARVADEELVGPILEGEKAAFDALYERYFPPIYGFVHRRLNDRNAAEEVTRGAFLALIRSLTRFRGEAPFAAWALAVTRRAVADRLEGNRSEPAPSTERRPGVTHRAWCRLDEPAR
jgi:DNA-directed RNA polymerase specialized sigma24 family protein